MFEPFRFSGHVENNVVVPDEDMLLPEGAKAEVRIEAKSETVESLEKARERRLRAAEKLLEFAKTLNLPADYRFDRGEANQRTDEY